MAAADIGIPAVPRDTKQKVAAELQELLVDFTALALNGKQAHWHVTGRLFVPLHAQLDVIVNDARAWADLVAERAITLGVPVDGRPAAVAEQTRVTPFQDGFVEDDKVLRLVAEELTRVTERTRAAADLLGDLDLVTQDLVIEIQRALEKHLWMVQAQLA